MAHADLRFLGCFGPTHTNDILAYDLSSNYTNFELVNIGGTIWLRNTGTGVGLIWAIEETPGFTRKTYTWYVGRVYVQTLGSGTVTLMAVTTSGSPPISIIMQDSGSGVNFGIRDTFGSGVYATGTEHTLRLEINGTTQKLWVNGTLELSLARTSVNASTDIALYVSGGAPGNGGYVIRHRHWFPTDSNNEAARPDGGTDVEVLFPVGDDVSATWGDETCAGAGATYTKWDDWASGVTDDATTFNCGITGLPGKEISRVTNPAPTVTGLFGVYVRARRRANVASKTVLSFTLIRDGSANEREVSNANVVATNWETKFHESFDIAPDAGAWTQTKLDDLRVGYRHPAGNGAHVQVTAMFVEAGGIGNDPPAAAGADRRRLLAG